MYLVIGSNITFPIIASNPHFLDADPIVLNAVEGLHPDDAMHRSFADIEPTTGSKYYLYKTKNIDLLSDD